MQVLCPCPHVPSSRRNSSVSLPRKHQQPPLLQGGQCLSRCYEKGGFVVSDKLVSWRWLISVLFDQSLAEVSLLSSWSAFPKWLVLAVLQYKALFKKKKKPKTPPQQNLFPHDIICFCCGSRGMRLAAWWKIVMRQWLHVEGKIRLMGERVKGCILMEEDA